MAPLIFLGGTVGNNPWREQLLDELRYGGVDTSNVFNPVVKDWNEEAQAAEDVAKAEADYMVFYIANPMQDGIPVSAYSMVEATMALYDRPLSTVVVFDHEGIEGHSLKAVKETERVLRKRHPAAYILVGFDELEDWIAGRLA